MKLHKMSVVCFAVISMMSTVVAQKISKSPQDLIAAIEKGEREIAADPWNQKAYTNHRLALNDLVKARNAGRTDLPDVQTFVDRLRKDHPNNICREWSLTSFGKFKSVKEYADHFELSLRFHVDRRGDQCAAELAKAVGTWLSKDGEYKRAEEFFLKQKALDPKDPFVDGYIREVKEKAHSKLMQDLAKAGAAEGSKEPKRVVMPDGDTYIGQVDAQNRPHGKGRLDRTSGNVYEGSFFDGQMTGYGVYKYTNGRKYEGEFYKSNFHGKGRYDAIEWVYTGDFVLSKMTGKGKLVYVGGPSKGEEYEGDFVDGKPTGQGTYRKKDGQIVWGTFENGRLVKPVK